jgi:hypothetical protein
MPDIYASITAADAATLERLAGALELRAADLLRRGILNDWFLGGKFWHSRTCATLRASTITRSELLRKQG